MPPGAVGALLLALPTALGAPYRFGRSAALFFGKVPRESKTDPEQVLLFEGLVRPSIEDSVLRPFAEAAEAVDVLVHTWESAQPSITAQLRAPLERLRRSLGARGTGAVQIDKPLSEAELLARAPHWSPYAAHQVNGLLSMERAVRLASHYEHVHKKPYELMLLMRLDLYFFRPFSFASLEVGPFYMANWCLATGAESRLPEKGMLCRKLKPSLTQLRGGHTGGAVPDFYFLSSGANIKQVFGNITGLAGWQPRFYTPADAGPLTMDVAPRCGSSARASENVSIAQQRCCNNTPRSCQRPKNLHGVVLPILRGLKLQHTVRRYLWHHLDFVMCRTGKRGLTWDTIHCAERLGGLWLRPPPDTAAWRPVDPVMSHCPNKVAFCDCSGGRDTKGGRGSLCRGKRARKLSCPIGGVDGNDTYRLERVLAYWVHSRREPSPSVTSSAALRRAIALARHALAAANASRLGA
eukprot:TRINITY_DN2029_c1_g2_i1.p1 TRINITY_DN2029_c1_g2~~TRINITY_DN2029_c1_g2_i1.p1  ORF type:complete len:466 (+),score=43.31 TRINITY_DN2029_c1_g2_i1:86-1483(+)